MDFMRIVLVMVYWKKMLDFCCIFNIFFFVKLIKTKKSRMEKIYLFYLPILFIGILVVSFLLTIIYEHKDESLRQKIVKLWAFSGFVAIAYPLIFDGSRMFSLIAAIVFIVLVIGEQKIRNVLLRENNLA